MSGKEDHPKTTKSASCLCGKANFSVTGVLKEALLCHCINCQKGSGSAFAYNQRFLDAKVQYQINNVSGQDCSIVAVAVMRIKADCILSGVSEVVQRQRHHKWCRPAQVFLFRMREGAEVSTYGAAADSQRRAPRCIARLVLFQGTLPCIRALSMDPRTHQGETSSRNRSRTGGVRSAQRCDLVRSTASAKTLWSTAQAVRGRRCH